MIFADTTRFNLCGFCEEKRRFGEQYKTEKKRIHTPKKD
jgi:hypothetical protein